MGRSKNRPDDDVVGTDRPRTPNGCTIPNAKQGLPGADYMLRGASAVFGLTADTPVEQATRS